MRILFGAGRPLFTAFDVLIRRRHLIGVFTLAGALSATFWTLNGTKVWESRALVTSPPYDDPRTLEWEWNRAVWAHELYGTPMPQMTY